MYTIIHILLQYIYNTIIVVFIGYSKNEHVEYKLLLKLIKYLVVYHIVYFYYQKKNILRTVRHFGS